MVDMTMVAGALFFFITASVFFTARLRSHIDHKPKMSNPVFRGLSSRIDGPIFFMMSGCTRQETVPGESHVADDFGGANSNGKKGGVSFSIAAAHVFISRRVATCGLYPVIVH
jgi:hypothetical protein